MKSKLLTFKIPESRYKKFIMLCVALDIDIISNYQKDDLFSENIIIAMVKIQKDNELSLELKEEKILSEYGKYIDNDNEES
jgi:hypothetical protein